MENRILKIKIRLKKGPGTDYHKAATPNLSGDIRTYSLVEKTDFSIFAFSGSLMSQECLVKVKLISINYKVIAGTVIKMSCFQNALTNC